MRRFFDHFRTTNAADGGGAEPYFIPATDLNQLWLLRDWIWLIETPHKVVSVTALGDMLLSNESGHVFFLDTINGELKEVATSEAEFVAKLGDPALTNGSSPT